MKRRLFIALAIAAVVFVFAGRQVMAFERLYEPTGVGVVEVKELPARLALSARSDGTYFNRDNNLFRTLFGYIKSNDIAMTVPVEAEIEAAEMRFFVASTAADNTFDGSAAVSVTEMPTRQVVSIGLRGSYSEATFERGRDTLAKWLAAQSEWMACAEPYAVYWNGPYVPSPWRRSEVHIAVTPASTR